MRLGHTIFEGSAWPRRTDLCCWWCTEPFATCPLAIPDRVHSGVYECFGVFCSYGCAKTYLVKDVSYARDQMTRSQLLTKLYKHLSGDDVSDQVGAPPRQTLQKFGGTLSIEDFRSGQFSKLRVCNLKFVPSEWKAIETCPAH